MLWPLLMMLGGGLGGLLSGGKPLGILSGLAGGAGIGAGLGALGAGAAEAGGAAAGSSMPALGSGQAASLIQANPAIMAGAQGSSLPGGFNLGSSLIGSGPLTGGALSNSAIAAAAPTAEAASPAATGLSIGDIYRKLALAQSLGGVGGNQPSQINQISSPPPPVQGRGGQIAMGGGMGANPGMIEFYKQLLRHKGLV